jgi:hypothetical protein
MATSEFFNKFPKLDYDINNNLYSRYEMVTNIFFRLGVVKETINNISSYYVYEVQSGDTPEILAEKVYGDAGAGWIILMANYITDPQFDWPMEYDTFAKYIVNKYGSIEAAKTGIHHYDKVITRTDSLSGVVTETRFQINYDALTNGVLQLTMPSEGDYLITEQVFVGESLANNTFYGEVVAWSNTTNKITLANTRGSVSVGNIIVGYYYNLLGVVSDILEPDVPFDYYLSLPESEGYEVFNIDGKTVTQTTKREAISNYDWEEKQNDARRIIKVIKAEYYPRIMSEFKNLTNTTESYLRKVK